MISCICSVCWWVFVATHLKNMNVKMASSGENKKYSDDELRSYWDVLLVLSKYIDYIPYIKVGCIRPLSR